jgi:hypothetical protein
MGQFVAQFQEVDTSDRSDKISTAIGLNSELQARIHDRLLAFIQHSYPLGIKFKFVDSAVLGWQPDRDKIARIAPLTSTISDPLVQSELMVNHGLNSYVAVGGIPDRLEMLIYLKPMNEALLEETLVQSLVGVDRAICAALQIEQPQRTIEVLITVHRAMTQGIQVWLRPPNTKPSPTLNSGEALILTKPLGSQALRAANPRHIQPMLSHLTQSNGPARSVLPNATAIAIGSAGFQAALDQWNQAAHQQGAHLVIRLGILSFLDRDVVSQPSRRQSLTDPELSGPLLFSVPVEQLAIVLKELRGAGYLDCRPIGWVRSGIGPIEFES